MKKLLWFCNVGVILASVSLASAQSIGEKTGINSALGITPKTEDFVKEVAVSDIFEIESSKLAQEKGNVREKTFANQMVTDHTKTSSEVKALISAGKVRAEVPASLDGSHQSKLDQLTAASGDDFAKNYADMQITAHQDAISLFDRYAKGGDNTDLKIWAGKTLPALRHHLEMAQGLKK